MRWIGFCILWGSLSHGFLLPHRPNTPYNTLQSTETDTETPTALQQLANRIRTYLSQDAPPPLALMDPYQDEFLDLCCSLAGERILSSLCSCQEDVTTLQSLCVRGLAVGLQGPPLVLQRRRQAIRNLPARKSRSIKATEDREAGIALLSELQRKQSPVGAWQLLQDLGVWLPHEDLHLLRSGFCVRFTDAELQSMKMHENVDERIDLCNLKVFTIDGENTRDIDDGLSLQVINNTTRVWMHIADASLASGDVGRQRGTSVYLPSDTLPMFPPDVVEQIALRSKSPALSLRVDLEQDGSIDASSIRLFPSLVDVTYALSYTEVDEMLYEGVARDQEWELGALLDVALLRQKYRQNQGSSESWIPHPLPYYQMQVQSNPDAMDGLEVELEKEYHYHDDSSASLMVSELMILAGECMGAWAIQHNVTLPFRWQPGPDFADRHDEYEYAQELLRQDHKYAHAWYCRRFMAPAQLDTTPAPHRGLGLSQYVQWTSPIRRWGDYQVHVLVKRHLRRERAKEMLQQGESIVWKDHDLGLPQGTVKTLDASTDWSKIPLDQDIDYMEGSGLVGAARSLQKMSHFYWLMEYLRRRRLEQDATVYTASVLGLVDPDRNRYAVYIEDLALEHLYTEPGGRLKTGTTLSLAVDTIKPKEGILTFVRASC